MYTTEEFREQVYLWYDTNGITVGDPSVGRWEHAHIVPRCEHGTETVLLLYGHHIMHDLVQSREYNRMCFWAGRTRAWLYGEGFLCENWFELVSLYEYYSAANGTQNCTRQFEGMTPEQLSAEMSRRRRTGWAAMTPEERSAAVRGNRWANASPEARAVVGSKTKDHWATLTPEERSTKMSRLHAANKTRWATMSPEERSAKMGHVHAATKARWAAMTPEDRSAELSRRAKLAWERRRAERALRSLGDELHGALWADDTL